MRGQRRRVGSRVVGTGDWRHVGDMGSNLGQQERTGGPGPEQGAGGP